MFAVIKTGGKQYTVRAGDVLRVELIDAVAGDKVQFNEILMVGGEKVTVGAPMVAGAAVQADVIDNIKGEKTIHFVKRRRITTVKDLIDPNTKVYFLYFSMQHCPPCREFTPLLA